MSRSLDIPERRAMRPLDDVRHRGCAWRTGSRLAWLLASLLVIAALFGIAGAPLRAQTTESVGMMWTATSPDHPALLLLPTLHMLAHEDPRIDATLAALAGGVSAIVLEGPTTYSRDLLAQVLQYGRYPADDNVTNHVKSMTAAALAQCARESDIDIVGFLQLKMWLAAATLDAHHLRIAGATASKAGGAASRSGLDMRLQMLAQKHHIPLIYLQTPGEAVQLLDGMPQDAQEGHLVAACAASHGNPPGYVPLEVFQRAWTDADARTLERLVTTKSAGESDALFASTEYIMSAGTRAFADTIERDGYFHGKGPILVAVGAGHFFGTDSLIERLRQAGYAVTPLQRPAMVSSR
jgi:uncharacterized protein YbaP (TraB family)